MNSRYYFIFLFSLSLISCNKEKIAKKDKKGLDTLVIYSEKDFYENKIGIFKIVDTLCINGIKRAKKDISENKLTYYNIKGLSAREVSDKELTLLLHQYNIGFENVLGFCMRPPKGFKWNCYEDEINNEIFNRYGENFVDSLRKIADRKFVETNPDFVFMWHECETTSRYTKVLDYTESLNMVREDLRKTLIPLYKTRGIEINDLNISFIIHRDSSISKLSITKSISPKNFENEKLVDSVITQFIMRSKWNPGKFNGINVNSDWHISGVGRLSKKNG